jgi:hypothetical protein
MATIPSDPSLSAPAPAPISVPSAPVPSASAPLNTYKYFPAPPIISSYHKYQDVNNDPNLQHEETLYFLSKVKEWIKYDKSYKKLQRFEKYIKGPKGYDIIHKLLKLFVKRGNTNWYDLKLQQDLVKDYIKHKLSKL